MAQRPRGILYSDQVKEAIHSVFPPQWFSRFKSHGNTKWKPQMVFWVTQIMNWQGISKQSDGFEAACDLVKKLFPRWTLGTSLSGFLEARQRVAGELGAAVHERLRKAGKGFEAWRVRGWMVFSVDGSRFDARRTTANEKGLGCAGKSGTTPQVFQTTLLHVGTGLPWNFRIGPGTDSERRHLDDMLDSLPSGSMLTADAGFISFDLCRWLIEQGRSFLLRVGSNVHLLKDMGWEEVEERGNIVYLWPHKHRRQPPVVLRLIVVQAEGREPVYLVTNVLDESTLSDEDAVEIYRRRWGIEVYYRTVKQTMDYSRLRSRRPVASLVEQSWNIHTTWLLQLLTTRRLTVVDKPPTSWSAAAARDQMRRALRRALAGGRCRNSETLLTKLQTATIDGYRRRGPKTTRVWPRQKQTQPPGPPNIQSASPTERQQAQRLQQATSRKF